MNQGSKKSYYRPNKYAHMQKGGQGHFIPPPKLQMHWMIGGQVSSVMFAATGDAGIVRANDTGRPYNVGGK